MFRRLIETLDRRRLALLCLAPTVLVLAVAAGDVVRDEGGGELGCWFLPNGSVLRPPGSELCPLKMNDRMVAVEENPYVSAQRTLDSLPAATLAGRLGVEMLVEQGEDLRTWELPIYAPDRLTQVARVGAGALIAVILMAIPLVLGRRSQESPAVPAITILYASLAFVAAVGTTSRSSGFFSEMAMLALAIGPAALLHLAITFPRVRPLVSMFPEIVSLPYASLVLLIPMGWLALHQSPLLWPSYLALVTALLGAAWLVLVLSCYFAWKESASALERSRSRVLLIGACIIPAPIAMVLFPAQPTVLEGFSTFLFTSAAVLPIPIGLAISRYDFLDGPRHSRSWLGTIAHLSGSSVVIAFGLGLALRIGAPPELRPDNSLVFLLAFFCSVVAEIIRTRTARLSEVLTTPGVTKFNTLRDQFQSEVQSYQDSHDVLTLFTGLITDTLGCRGAAVMLVDGDGYTEALATGEGVGIEGKLSEQALTALEGLPIAHTELMHDQPGAPSVEQLQRDGVRVIAELRHRSLPVGMLLLGERNDGTPYTGTDLEFVTRVCEVAAGSLHNLRLVERNSGPQRSDPLQSVAEALSHDLGKEVDWMTRLVRRLPHATTDRDKLRRDIGLVLDITSNLSDSLKDFLGQAESEVGEGFPVEVEALLASVVKHAEAVYADKNLQSIFGDEIAGVRVDRSIERVVTNLVDNALQASPEDASVRIFANVNNEMLRIVVEDKGAGISPEVAPMLFASGFTTRSDRGGQGIGLSSCSEILCELEGAMGIVPARGGGTRATILVPVH